MASGPSTRPVSAPGSRVEVVTTRQDGHTRAGRHGAPKHDVGQSAAGMARDHDVGGDDLDVLDIACKKPDTAGKSGPGLHQRFVQRRAGCRENLVDDQRFRRRVVEQQHHVCEQPVTAAQIDNAPSAKQPPDTPGDLPRLVELLARQTPGVAHGARHPVNSVSSGERPRSRSVRRPFDERENVRDQSWPLA